jgi:hypothetical protein
MVLALLPGIACAYTAFLDQFAVNRFDLPNNGALFLDPFEDGFEPPSAPDFLTGGGASYGVFPTPPGFPSGAEDGGRLALDSSIGALVVTGAGDTRRLFRGTLNTNTDSTNTVLGLKRNHSFLAAGRFDLTSLPAAPSDAFGIELHDALPGGMISELSQVFVRRTADPGDPNLYITFVEQSPAGGGLAVRGNILFEPPAGATQITLFLRHATPDTDQITAEYRFWDVNGALSNPIALPGTATMFDGEMFVRAAFVVVEVPEPGTYVMLLAGLGILGWVARRRMKG